MDEDRFDDQLSAAARAHHEPPETPREVMWARIVAARNEGTRERGNDVPTFRPLAWAAGIAAILALGIGLGRWTAERTVGPSRPVVTAVEPSRTNAAAYYLATTEHLSQSEAFLTLFRASVRGPGDERLASGTARQLLATNRLLLDSPAARDARIRVLLQDLELVLAEIAQLSPSPRGRDLDLITQGLQESGVLSRLRTAVPAGASVTQGAL